MMKVYKWDRTFPPAGSFISNDLIEPWNIIKRE